MKTVIIEITRQVMNRIAVEVPDSVCLEFLNDQEHIGDTVEAFDPDLDESQSWLEDIQLSVTANTELTDLHDSYYALDKDETIDWLTRLNLPLTDTPE